MLCEQFHQASIFKTQIMGSLVGIELTSTSLLSVDMEKGIKQVPPTMSIEKSDIDFAFGSDRSTCEPVPKNHTFET